MDHDEARVNFHMWVRMIHELAGKPTVRLVAKHSGLSHQTVSTTLAGSTWPRWDTVRMIALALGVDRNAMRMGWLFWWHGDRGERIDGSSEHRDQLVVAVEGLTAAVRAQTVMLSELAQEFRAGRVS